MKGIVSAQLYEVQTKQRAQSRKQFRDDEATSSSWTDRSSNIGQPSGMKRRSRSMRRPDSGGRTARVEQLRAQVRAGTYRVDSMTLARCILENESHLMDTC